MLNAMMVMILLMNGASAHKEVCSDHPPAAFSSLGSRLKALDVAESGDLLAVRLLVHDDDVCRLAYEIELLLPDGRIDLVTFDAESLTEMTINDRGNWSEFEDGGEGGDDDDDDRGGRDKNDSDNDDRGGGNDGGGDGGGDGD